jgi:DNA-binding transcriptional ArsR family regulator
MCAAMSLNEQECRVLGENLDVIFIRELRRQRQPVPRRGSSAINAHADVVICQERHVESDVEIVYFGGYMKDSADVEPIALVESNHESFFWTPSANVPDHLRKSFELLRATVRSFKSESDTVSVLTDSKVTRSTAYRHVKQLLDGGFLAREQDGSVKVNESVEPRP